MYGTFRFLITSVFLYKLLAQSAVETVLNRFIPELFQAKDYTRLKKLIFRGLLISCSFFAVLIVLVTFNKNELADFFHLPNIELYFAFYILFVFSSFINQSIINILSSLLLHRYISIFRIVSSCLRPILYIVLFPYLTINVLLLIESILVLSILLPSVFVLLIYISKLKTTTQHTIPGCPIKKRIIRYGLYSSFNELGAGIIGKTSDYFIIAALGDPFIVGLYAFAYKIYELIYRLLPLKDFLTVVRPLFFQQFTKRYDKEEFISIYNLIVKIMLPIYLFPFVYFLVFGKPFITFIFDPKYLDSYWVANILLASNLTVAFFYPLGITTQLKEKMEIALYSKIVVIFSICAGIAGMKLFGLIGVACATAIGDLLKYLFILFFMRKHADIKYSLKDYRNYFLLPFVIIVICYPLQKYIYNIWILLIFSSIYLILFVSLFVGYHSFNSAELKLLKKSCKSSKIINKVSRYVVGLHKLMHPKPNGSK